MWRLVGRTDAERTGNWKLPERNGAGMLRPRERRRYGPAENRCGKSLLPVAEWKSFPPSRGVAQPGRARSLGLRCRQFESGRPDHSSLRESLKLQVYSISGRGLVRAAGSKLVRSEQGASEETSNGCSSPSSPDPRPLNPGHSIFRARSRRWRGPCRGRPAFRRSRGHRC